MTDFELARRLDEIAESRNGGPEAAANVRSWVYDRKPFVDSSEVRKFAQLAPADLLIDSFRSTIPFGTGGRRGPVGIGPNRINLRTVALTAAGHAEYLRKTATHRNLRVIVANDTRVFHDINQRHGFMGIEWPMLGVSSRSLALLACKVYAVHGIVPYITSPYESEAFMPTPELSYAIREMEVDGGLNVSASHNHPDDNGLKVYNSKGGQYFPPADEGLARAVEYADLSADLAAAAAMLNDAAKPLPDSLHRSYIDFYVKMDADMCKRSLEHRLSVPVVYTPLSGTGLASVGEVLGRSGYNFSVPPDQYPDGSFAAIPMRSPNPEIPGVATPATNYASSVRANLVLSTDPDADRLGVEAKLHDGTWKHFTGNKIATILAYFLIADKRGPKLPGYIIATVATSKVLGAIGALGRNVTTVDELMIGFKFIGQYLESLEVGGDTNTNLILAAEESHGFLTTTRIHDKDAASAAFIVAHLHVEMQRRGKTLWDYLMEVYARTGVHVEFGRSLGFPGAEGAGAIRTMMSSLRDHVPPSLGGEPIVSTKDYLDLKPTESSTQGERAAFDIVEIASEHYRVVIRPSGTEAKLKYYFDYHEAPDRRVRTADRYESVEQVVWSACRTLYSNLAARAGYRLTESALDLPDVMPVPEKAEKGGS
jgi:phosphoglucomutase